MNNQNSLPQTHLHNKDIKPLELTRAGIPVRVIKGESVSLVVQMKNDKINIEQKVYQWVANINESVKLDANKCLNSNEIKEITNKIFIDYPYFTIEDLKTIRNNFLNGEYGKIIARFTMMDFMEMLKKYNEVRAKEFEEHNLQMHYNSKSDVMDKAIRGIKSINDILRENKINKINKIK